MKHIYFYLFIVMLLCSCTQTNNTTSSPLEISVTKVSLEKAPLRREFIGQIYSNYDITIQPRISGFLLSSHFSNGMPVKKGQLIFRIDPTQLRTNVAQARASLFSAEAQLVEARNNYERAIPLAKIKAVSQTSLDQYKAAFLSAEANQKAAVAALENARLNLSYTDIYSPIDGIISHSEASAGDYVGVGTKFSILTTISNIDSISCQLAMPMTEYLQYRKQAGINTPIYENDSLLRNIRLSLADGSVYSKQGFYKYTKKDIGEDMGAIIFVVGFDNLQGELKVGQYAKVSVDIGSPRNIIVVPQRAVSQSQGINSLWVMKPDSTVEYRQITLAGVNGNNWIVQSGLEANETILLEGSLKVHNGMKISPIYTENTNN